MKSKPINTNLDIYTNMLQAFTQKPDQPPSPEEMMLTLYQGKIMDLFWFKGKLPEKLSQVFSYSMNEDWPNPFVLPHNLTGIYGLSLEESAFICDQIKKPEWVGSSQTGFSKLSYSDIKERWESL